METLLDVRGLASGYGDVPVLHDVSLHVGRGEVVAVIGANGAGKSTLLLTISGHLRARTGSVVFADEPMTGVAPQVSVARGIVMVPEGGRLFPFSTVLENLELGAYHARARRSLRRNLEEVFELFPVLAERRRQLAGRLSGGERQMCAMARAMMSEPALLMLDEPSLGLAPIMVEKLFTLMQKLVEAKGLTVLLVEQNVADALQMSQRAYVMERGRVVQTGRGQDLLANVDLQRAYMGI
jgi:branched-chain amino acid transport system ATP-binding protein